MSDKVNRKIKVRGKREEITDIIEELQTRYTLENFRKLGIKVGRVLTFSQATIRVTKVA